jgi:hypothetical protein|tara:strand:- start:2030 stop:2194 length:165 start_codon:yes stop_codon:yes gene_type:complete
MTTTVKNSDFFKKVLMAVYEIFGTSGSLYVDEMNMEIVVRTSHGTWRIAYTEEQ